MRNGNSRGNEVWGSLELDTLRLFEFKIHIIHMDVCVRERDVSVWVSACVYINEYTNTHIVF